MGVGAGTQVSRLGGECLYLLNHLIGLKNIIYFTLCLSQMPSTLTLSFLLTGLLRGSNEPTDSPSVHML